MAENWQQYECPFCRGEFSKNETHRCERLKGGLVMAPGDSKKVAVDTSGHDLAEIQEIIQKSRGEL